MSARLFTEVRNVKLTLVEGHGVPNKRRSMLPKELYTIKEAAHILGLGERTVFKLIEQGTLKSVRIKMTPRAKSGARRITKAQLTQFIDKLEVESKFKR